MPPPAAVPQPRDDCRDRRPTPPSPLPLPRRRRRSLAAPPSVVLTALASTPPPYLLPSPSGLTCLPLLPSSSCAPVSPHVHRSGGGGSGRARSENRTLGSVPSEPRKRARVPGSKASQKASQKASLPLQKAKTPKGKAPKDKLPCATMMLMYKMIFLFWQEGCTILLKLFSSQSIKQKGLRHDIATARQNHGDDGKATELALVKELERLGVADKFSALLSMWWVPLPLAPPPLLASPFPHPPSAPPLLDLPPCPSRSSLLAGPFPHPPSNPCLPPFAARRLPSLAQ